MTTTTALPPTEHQRNTGGIENTRKTTSLPYNVITDLYIIAAVILHMKIH